MTKHSKVVVPSVNPVRESTVQYTYTFLHWLDKSQDVIYNGSMTVKGDMEFHAVFKEQVRQYNVKFISEGKPFHTSRLDYDSIVDPPMKKPEKLGDSMYATYTFDGWSGLTSNTKVKGDMEFHARFKPSDPVYYTLTYILNNAPSNLYNPDPVEVPYGMTVDLSELWVYGYTVEVKVNGVSMKDNSFKMPAKDTKVECDYTEVIQRPTSPGDKPDTDPDGDSYNPSRKYTVEFVSEGAVIQSLKVSWYSLVKAPESDPVKASTDQYDYEFVRWDGYSETLRITKDCTFEAVFEEVLRVYTVKFMYRDTEVSSSMMPYGAVIESPDVDLGEGFIGWNGYEDGMTVSGNHTFTAVIEGDPIVSGDSDGSEGTELAIPAILIILGGAGAMYLRMKMRG